MTIKTLTRKGLLALTVTMFGVVLALGLSACSGQESSGGSGSQGLQAESSQSNEGASEGQDGHGSDTNQDSQASGKKTLVVYYSATGNTKDVAEKVAEAADASIFEVVPTEPYTDDDLNWNEEGSRVNKEHEDESLRDVSLKSTNVPNWDNYDIVFVGYPIWWVIAAWPIDGFVKANDFSGKMVIPFATSTSSGMGESGSNLEKLAGTGDWQEGQRFSSGATADEVKEWVEGLSL